MHHDHRLVCHERLLKWFVLLVIPSAEQPSEPNTLQELPPERSVFLSTPAQFLQLMLLGLLAWGLYLITCTYLSCQLT